MKKRVISAVLWAYTGWYAGALIATMFGVTAMLGPALGILGAVLIAGDPFHLIWRRARALPEPTSAPMGLDTVG